jgi:pyrroline-5-carboxylate reductase
MTTADNQQVVNKSDLLVLAVKPKDVENVLKNIRDPLLPKNHLLISIAAGIRTTTIEQVGWIDIP